MHDPTRMTLSPDPAVADANAEETINDLVARRPELMPVLQRFGFDLCCGGGLTLREAAGRHGLPLATLMSALADVGARSDR